MTGRNAFTSDDDSLLVKYIATYNPGVQGRNGNSLYKRLCENAEKKWSWGARHPWQSWRERYTKDASRFNKRIRNYQEKHRLPAENAGHINGTKSLVKMEDDTEEADIPAPTRKRKRKSDENARKRLRREEESGDSDEEPSRSKRQQAPKPSSSPPPPRDPEIHPEISTLDVCESSERATESESDSPPPPRRKAKAKAVAVPSSSSAAASPKTNVTVEKPKSKPHPSGRPLPKVVTGPYRNEFTGTRRVRDTFSSDEEDKGNKEQWPPTRTSKTRSKVVPKPKPGSADEMDELEEVIVPPGAEPNPQELENGDVTEQHPRTSLPPPPPRLPAPLTPKAAVEPARAASPQSEWMSDKERARPEPSPAPRPHRSAPPPQQVNAVASSSRVQLTPPSAPLPSVHLQSRSPVKATPTAVRAQVHRPSVQKNAAGEWLARLRQGKGKEMEMEPSQSSPKSPIDWGSPVKRPADARLSPGNEEANDFPGIEISRNISPRRSVNGSTENGSTRRSRAPSPGSVRNLDLGRNSSLQSIPTPVDPIQPPYRLLSPRPASSHGLLRHHLDFRPGTQSYEGTPLAGKAKGKSKALTRDGSAAPATTSTTDAHARRHSLPALAHEARLAGAIPRIDFEAGKIGFTAPLKMPSMRAASVSGPFKRRVSGSSLKEVLTRRSLPVSAREKLPIAPPPQLDEEQLASKYNQPIEVVRDVIEATGEGAEMVLRRMKEAAERARREALEEMGVRLKNESKEGEEDSSVFRRKRPREGGDGDGWSGQRNQRESSRQVEMHDASPSALHSRGRTKERERQASTSGRADGHGAQMVEESFVLHHRRRDPAPHKKVPRTSAAVEEEEFRPRPLVRDVFADIGYTPPSRSRARVAQKQLGLGRGRVSNESTPQVQPTTPATSSRTSQEEQLHVPRFEDLAGDMRVLKDIEGWDLSVGFRMAGDVVAYMCSEDLPSPSRN